MLTLNHGENCQEALQALEWRVEEVNFQRTALQARLRELGSRDEGCMCGSKSHGSD